MNNKIIKLGNQEIQMEANAMTRMYYRTKFNRHLLSDLMKSKDLLPLIDKLKDSNKDEWLEQIEVDDMEKLEDFADNCLKIAYTMAYSHDKNILPYEEWIESLGDFKLFDTWLSEVLGLVMSTFR